MLSAEIPAVSRIDARRDVERCDDGSMSGFLFQFLVAEVLRFVLQKHDLIHQVIGLEHRIELPRDGPGECAFEQRRDALALSGDHTADHVLQE